MSTQNPFHARTHSSPIDLALERVYAGQTGTAIFTNPDDAETFSRLVLERYHPDGYGTYCVIDKDTGCRVQWRVWGAE